MVKKEITAIIQARIGSSRFKGKVLKKIKSKEVILLQILRLKKCKNIKRIIVAIPNNKENVILKNFLASHSIDFFTGSENNVLKRYYDCSVKNNIKHILRITADCPLIDPHLIDQLATRYSSFKKIDYLSNIIERSYPDGMDAEFFSFEALKNAFKNVIYKDDKEHVTKYFLRSDRFIKKNISFKNDYSKLRITLDYKEDFQLIDKIFNNFTNIYFSLNDIIKFYKNNLNLFKNHQIMIDYKSQFFTEKNLSNTLWEEAKYFIAGGNSLFSKRPDTFLPNKWPSYFKSAKGCVIKDVNNRNFYDVCTMSVGTNVLGYANNVIDKAVIKRIKNGNMSTLNCVEEINLAKKLIEIHPWANKVRFARTGGEANAIAVRLARSGNKKTKIAFCGYHGWHDWYLAANLKNSKNLNQHLLEGLKSSGVYKGLVNSVIPFEYNNFEMLEKIIKKNPDIGIIKMEVIRNIKPKKGFLKKVRNLANQKDIILIFDECTTGFRACLGGIHKIYGVEPDMMILGKAMGNGYPITAVLGKDKIMKNIGKTFISSTFWTESIGPTAALKTIEQMEKFKSWTYLTRTGKLIIDRWKKLSKKHNLGIKIYGIPSLCSFVFDGDRHDLYKALITQELLKKGILATNTIYVSTAHTKTILKKYFFHLNEVFGVISRCEKGEDVHRYLNSSLPIKKFDRLN